MTTSGDLPETIEIVDAWNKFRLALNDFTNSVEECAVELAFESSKDHYTHCQFSPDEPVFINNVEVLSDNRIIFICTYGSNNKWFYPIEAELINYKKDGESGCLLEAINGIFKESFAAMPQFKNITTFEKLALTGNAELHEALNDSGEFIRKYKLDQERTVTYGKMDDFGSF